MAIIMAATAAIITTPTIMVDITLATSAVILIKVVATSTVVSKRVGVAGRNGVGAGAMDVGFTGVNHSVAGINVATMLSTAR